MIYVHSLDPILFSIVGLPLRWYGIAYALAFLSAWFYLKKMGPRFISLKEGVLDDFVFLGGMGVILGGRLGYILFYRLDHYFANPLEILKTWEGGMSFHGGFLGVVLAGLYCVRKHNIPALRFGDLLAGSVPLGLFFGRLANFINGELAGRLTDGSWGVIFPAYGPAPRHPSQLYEAFLEGLLLFLIILFCSLKTSLPKKPGALCGLFIAGYGLGRSVAECFREPDSFLGFFSFGLTMGQILSFPLIIVGLYLLFRHERKA